MRKKPLQCLRCGADMEQMARVKLQLGQTGWFLGDLPNLLAGAMEVDVLRCPQCGKVEFFDPTFRDETGGKDEVRERVCPRCGFRHVYWPRCTNCGYEYPPEETDGTEEEKE